jgi:hypothetical protein
MRKFRRRFQVYSCSIHSKMTHFALMHNRLKQFLKVQFIFMLFRFYTFKNIIDVFIDIL